MIGITGFLESDLGMHREFLDKCGTHTGLTTNEGLRISMSLGLGAAAVQTCRPRNIKSALSLFPEVSSVTVAHSAQF